MKATLLTLLFIAIAYCSIAQIPINAISIEDEAFNDYFLNENNIPIVKGKIINLEKNNKKKFKVSYSIVTPFEQLQIKKESELNSDGSFELKIDNAFPYQQIWINIEDLFYTGVYANTDLFIKLDAAILKNKTYFNGPGIKYMGQDGLLNEYINNNRLFKPDEKSKIDSQIQNNIEAIMSSNDDFIKKNDSLYTLLANIDKEYIKKNPSKFSWIIENNQETERVSALCLAHWGKNMPDQLLEKVKLHKPYLTSNEGILFYKYFFTYLSNAAIRKLLAEKVPYEILPVTIQIIDLLDSLFEPSKSDFFKIQISSKDPNEKKLKKETVLPHIKTMWCKKIMQDQYLESVEKLATINKILSESKAVDSPNQLGQPVAEFPFGAKLYKIDSVNPDSLLSNLKKSFIGKALLIDFWATWCGPCISEFPYSKKLNDQSKDLPVEFVYLCTSQGSSLEKWKSKIAEYKLNGTHIYLEESIENSLMNLFSSSGFPSYVLIDKNGEYRPGVAKRPSEMDRDKLTEQIR